MLQSHSQKGHLRTAIYVMAQPNGNAAEKMDGHTDGDIKQQTDGVKQHRDPPCVAHSLRREEGGEAEDVVSSTLVAIEASHFQLLQLHNG